MALKTTPWDAAKYLDSAEMIAAYLNSVLEDGSPAEIANALATVDRARRMHGARSASEDDGSCTSVVTPNDLETVRRGLNALGLRLQVAAA